jgi:hypothetical protein
MTRRRVRIVVIVRCPLCGGWIVGNSYGDHVENVHLGGPERGLEVPMRGPDPQAPTPDHNACKRLLEALRGDSWEADVEGMGLTPDRAGEILYELGRRRSQGQDASLGFELFE